MPNTPKLSFQYSLAKIFLNETEIIHFPYLQGRNQGYLRRG